MICLRLWRSLLSGRTLGRTPNFALFGPATLPCALPLGLLGLLLASGPCASAAAAANRSRTRHITPALTPLHYTERSFSAPHHGNAVAKHGSVAKHGAVAKHGSAASSTHPAAKHGHGGKHGQDAGYDAPVPMLRARSGQPHGSAQLAWAKSHSRLDVPAARASAAPRGRRIPLPAPDPAEAQDTVVAEVSGRSAHGDTLARLHKEAANRPGSHVTGTSHSAGPVVVASAGRPAPSVAAGEPGAAPIERHAAPTVQALTSQASNSQPSNSQASNSQTPAAHAYGTARPEDLDRPAPSSGRYIPPTPSVAAVTVQAPSAGRPAPAAPPAQVVDGFGSELALAPALPADRPGLTRRRNHPIPASALSEDARSSAPAVLAANLPSTLAERDAITAGAMTPSILSPNLPNIYDEAGRLVVPAPLRGSREVLIHQNTMADSDGLERIENDTQLNRLRATGQIVDLPVSPSLRVNDNLPYNRRSARPWTALFTQDIARDYYARFRQPLWVTSAVRTVAFQSRLIRVNGNAAGLSGDFASPHLTGQAIDFGKRGMTAAQLAWMRSYLLPLIQSGKIDVEEEFQQACFHISVYRRYAGGRHLVSPTMQVASQATAPAYPPPQPPRAAGPPPITPLTNPEITDTDE